MRRILSTKQLDVETLGHAHMLQLAVNCVDFIETHSLTWNIEQVRETDFEAIAFTSTNALEAFIENPDYANVIMDKQVFAISGKTSKELLKLNITPGIVGDDSMALAAKIIAARTTTSLLHICGNKKMETLGEQLLAEGIGYHPLMVYETNLTSKSIAETYDAVLFFSPSGVESFFQKNQWHDATVGCCIGYTTASALKAQGVNNIVVSQKPSPIAMLDLLNEYHKFKPTKWQN